jgi:hypothetical protein
MTRDGWDYVSIVPYASIGGPFSHLSFLLH